jgi:hypothetical protein
MSSDKPIRGNHLAKHGAALVDMDWPIVPIAHGKKAPGFDGWQHIRADHKQVKDWLEHGHRGSGVGILTKFFPAIDIDCRDADCAEHMKQFVLRMIPDTLIRIGHAPKLLMMSRTESPFRKMRSGKWIDDEWLQHQQIEILGDGQQFVAFHIHPDTGKEYVWVNDRSPLNTKPSSIPMVTKEQYQAICDELDRYAADKGWKLDKKARVGAGNVSGDNPWAEDSPPIDISPDELRIRTMQVKNPEDYERWTNVGMALYHQFDGDVEGFELWKEWSETADNYDEDACDRKWDTFEVVGKKRAPMTARAILMWSKEAVAETTAALGVSLRDAFTSAKDLADWEKARNAVREAEIDSITRATLAPIAKESRDRVTQTKTPIIEIKKALAYAPKDAEATPKWASPWVYDVSDDRFFHKERKIAVTKQGFDAMNNRHAISKKDILDGKNVGSQVASQLALDHFRLQNVHGRRYIPGGDEIVHTVEGIFANTYGTHEIPDEPTVDLPVDRRNIAIVKRHFEHLLSPKEARMFLDWLSWVVQNPGQHANHAVLLQGVEGDGKSFFAELLRTVMGASNVTMLNAHILQSDFTDWAEGQCVACVEEVRIIADKNKFETLNRIKPFITNQFIEIHPKGQKVRNVVNTTSYFLTSNFQDALPIDDNDSRYLVFFSKFQSKAQIGAFESKNPRYYTELYNTLIESPGALRKWLLAHEQQEGFNAKKRAPETDARRAMVRNATPDFMQHLDELIEGDKVLEVSSDLLDVTSLPFLMTEFNIEFPKAKSLNSMLGRAGFQLLGKQRIENGELRTFYSRTPELFQQIGADGKTAVGASIRLYLQRRREKLNDDEL